MSTKPIQNQLLSRIPKVEFSDLLSLFRQVPLEQSKVLYEARAPIDYAYFPNCGTLSAVVVMANGNIIEVGTVGNEGGMGIPTVAPGGSSTNRVFVQVPGNAMRIEAKILDKAIQQSNTLRRLFLKYQDAFSFQVSQSVACNGLHALPERCCRWLLMTLDRVEGDVLLLTHEFMSAMLGVRRSSVTEILHDLKERGLVTYSRGKITVTNRPGLEKGACECYRAVRDEYHRLLG